jgi:serine/threonine-protein kinase RsbW
MSVSRQNDMRLRLELTSVPEAVRLVRSIVNTVTGAAGLDQPLVEDMRTAISEACNNVVLHAYPDNPGPLIVSLAARGDSIEAVVRDQGGGIRPGPGHNRGLGMGLTLINSLADRAEFQSSELGTEVRMQFRCPLSVQPGQVSLGDWALTDPRSSGALRARSD